MTASVSAARVPSGRSLPSASVSASEVEDVRVVERSAAVELGIGGKPSVASPVIAVNDVFGGSPNACRSSL